MLKTHLKSEKTGREWCQYFSVPVSKTRIMLFEVLTGTEGPQSVPEIQSFLAKEKRFPNKTTLYREIENLLNRGILSKVQLSETRTSYEITSDHHHHFVCSQCDEVTKLSFCEPIIKKVEALLVQQGKSVAHHNFEFFGICENCNKEL